MYMYMYDQACQLSSNNLKQHMYIVKKPGWIPASKQSVLAESGNTRSLVVAEEITTKIGRRHACTQVEAEIERARDARQLSAHFAEVR